MISRVPCHPTVLKNATLGNAHCERAAKHARQALIELPRWESLAPIPEHTKLAFDSIQHLGAAHERKLAVDIGCGTGRSTRALAVALKHVNVLGVDRSEVRLNKGTNALQDNRAEHEIYAPENAHVIRADIEHLWRLAVHAGWRTEYQFFFYPNPYPRNKDHKRRLYGRPSFPYSVKLGGRVEVRGTSEQYLHEFRAAYLELAESAIVHDSNVHSLNRIDTNILPSPISNFEAKYLLSNKPLFRLVLDDRAVENRVCCPLVHDDIAIANAMCNSTTQSP